MTGAGMPLTSSCLGGHTVPKNYLRVFPEQSQSQEWQTHEDEGLSGALNDKVYVYLDNLGYSGSLSDKLYYYWVAPSGEGFPYTFPLTLS